jgi:hypothetical protein
MNNLIQITSLIEVGRILEDYEMDILRVETLEATKVIVQRLGFNMKATPPCK